MWTIIWLIVLTLTLIVEFLTLGLASIWFSGGALVATILSLFGVPWYIQIIAFVIVSIALLVLTRPVAVKYFNNKREMTNVDGVIGQSGVVLEEINNIQATGRIKIGGLEWSARAAEPEQTFAVGDIVTVESVDGVKLMVRLAEEKTEE